VYVDRAAAKEKCELEDEENPDPNYESENNRAIVDGFVDECINFRVKWMLKMGLVRLSKYGLRDLFE